MTKSPSRRARGAMFAALSFAALATAGLVATPAAAQPAPSTSSVMYGTGSTTPVDVTDFASDVTPLNHTLAHCPDQLACLFTGANYTGSKAEIPATSVTVGAWGVSNVTIRSAKNTFDNRRIQIGRQRADGSIAVLRCLNPNSKRPGPFPDGSRFLRIGRLGTRC